MDPDLFRRRTKSFGLGVIRLVASLPDSPAMQVIARQLVKAGTSVGANYRAACRARSRADFVGKLKITEEECDETLYWLELLVETGSFKPDAFSALVKEGNEILSMVVSSIKTARS